MRIGMGCGGALLLLGLAAPAAAQRGDGMGAFPQVVEGPGDTLQAIFHQNGCTITYDARDGRELTRRSACTSAQRNFADNAIADYRRASPAERVVGRDAYGRDVIVEPPRRARRNRYADRYYQDRRDERPTISTDLNGDPSANFRSPGCVVYYGADGRRRGYTQHCTRSQIRRAAREMEAWMDGIRR